MNFTGTEFNEILLYDARGVNVSEDINNVGYADLFSNEHGSDAPFRPIIPAIF